MIKRNRRETSGYIFTHHGLKKKQGFLAIINGEMALAYNHEGKIIGYTTLKEITKEFYSQELPTYNVDF